MTITTRILDNLDSIETDKWQTLADRSPIDTSVFLTPQWQRSWWAAFGRGVLLPILVSRGDEPVLLATLFIDGDMAFFVGAGGSDYLDFVGDVTDVAAVTSVLTTVLDAVPNLLGFRLHHVPDWSPTSRTLAGAADHLGLELVEEGRLGAPFLDIAADPKAAAAAPRKKSLVRHERWFEREGDLLVEHLTEPTAILPHLDTFFDQHIVRWASAGVESQFHDPKEREFFRAVVDSGGQAGWLRFARVAWDDRSIALHLGFSYRRSFLWYKPTYAIDLAKRSPGEVLMRSLLLEALDDDAATFDFGLGQESFKDRFATGVRVVRNWGLYPSDPQG